VRHAEPVGFYVQDVVDLKRNGDVVDALFILPDCQSYAKIISLSTLSSKGLRLQWAHRGPRIITRMKKCQQGYTKPQLVTVRIDPRASWILLAG